MHPGAPAAHAAAEAAHRQGRFWAMHDKIFANPRDVNAETLARYAREIGLDLDRFRRDSASEAVRDRIRADAAEAKELGVTGTPAFFVNGRFLSGAQPFSSFKRLIEEELKDSP
jgi:predicted DsbA family dithiol-disulfide isomerase